MSNTSRSNARNFITIVLSLLIIVGAVWMFLNRQFVLDTFTNWSYEPSTAIKSIEARTDFTQQGKFIFYATRPEVLEQDVFNQECPRQEPGSPILGCYTSTDRIFMYNVTDEKLDGMKEVTAAHEMLHAVWHRIGQEERDRLTPILEDAYVTYGSESLKSRMEYYSRTEPEHISNELHSILGTEVSNLGAELESYYAQYFNRETILALYSNYNNLYEELSDEADRLHETMQGLTKVIDDSIKTYNADVEVYSRDVRLFNQRADSNGFSSSAQFYNERATLVARSAQLETVRQQINANIQIYNTQYTHYQKIADQLQLLHDSMDSYHTLEQAPSV